MRHPDNSVVYNEDCGRGMKRYPDKYFDLAVVDPPYGIGEDGASNHSRGRLATAKLFTPKGWDKEPPTCEYFKELMRVSKHQIIWGANHFADRFKSNSSSWIVWDKMNGDTDFADCELAFTSHRKAVRQFTFRWQGMLQGDMKNKEERIHPTQKPVVLYDWIYKNYLPSGGKVIDTHLGSGSNRIAADKAGNIDFVGFELDKDYYEAQEKRWNTYKQQLTLF
ncbi:MAG TPA: DNA methyltransferase [Cytophagales bacterium]|nr:DNA methyltransferase [Cytophagales bacterium]